MLRMLVFSDSHGDFMSMYEAIQKQPQAEIIFHLGDGVKEMEEIQSAFPTKNIFGVRGNCDWGSLLPYEGDAQIGGIRIFYTHGHLDQVKYGDYPLLQKARERKSNLVLFGHTHQALVRYEEGLHIMNPGSIGASRGSARSYGVVDLSPAGIAAHIVEVK